MAEVKKYIPTADENTLCLPSLCSAKPGVKVFIMCCNSKDPRHACYSQLRGARLGSGTQEEDNLRSVFLSAVEGMGSLCGSESLPTEGSKVGSLPGGYPAGSEQAETSAETATPRPVAASLFAGVGRYTPALPQALLTPRPTSHKGNQSCALRSSSQSLTAVVAFPLQGKLCARRLW